MDWFVDVLPLLLVHAEQSKQPETFRATASKGVKFLSILQTKHTFFYFTHPLLQNTHVSLSILNIYSIKYSFFYIFLLFPSMMQKREWGEEERNK